MFLICWDLVSLYRSYGDLTWGLHFPQISVPPAVKQCRMQKSFYEKWYGPRPVGCYHAG